MIAEQVADYFTYSGYAFVEEDKIDGLAAVLGSFLTVAGIPVNPPDTDDPDNDPFPLDAPRIDAGPHISDREDPAALIMATAFHGGSGSRERRRREEHDSHTEHAAESVQPAQPGRVIDLTQWLYSRSAEDRDDQVAGGEAIAGNPAHRPQQQLDRRAARLRAGRAQSA